MSWEKVKLGECIDVISGFAFKTKDFCNSGIPIIKIKNVNPPYVSLEDLTYIPVDLANKIPKYELSYDDILIAMTGSHINQWASVVGRVAKVKYRTRSMLNQRVGKIILKENAKANLDYIYYFLTRDEVKIELAAKAGGAANQANISPTDIKNLEIPFPPIKTQNKIADILSAYDNLIENNQKQIKLLEEAAQRLYKQWFIDLRYPGHETTKIVDGISQGWSVKTVDDIAEYINGYAFKPSDWQTKGYPIIKIKEMNEGVTADTPRNSGETIPPKYVIGSGDIVFSWSATLAVIIWDGETGLLNQHLFKVIPHKDFSREFVLQTIKNTLEEFQNLTTGSTMKHIQRGKLKEVKVNMPTSNIMKEFEKITEPIRNQILNKKKQILDLIQSRDRLLPKLMNNELEV